MKQILLRGGLPIMATVALTGCIDDNYDLSDIDTTSEFKVKDLVLPINMDKVLLGDIINIKEGDQIKEITINGEPVYAVEEEGTFSSDNINIPGFIANVPPIRQSHLNFGNIHGVAGGSFNLSAGNIKNLLEFKCSDVDDAIVGIDELFLRDFEISLDFNYPGDLSAFSSLEFSKVELTVPSGLDIANVVPSDYTYDPATGKLTISSIPFNTGSAKITLNATSIKPVNPITIVGNTLDFTSNVDIDNVTISGKTVAGMTLPSDLSLTVDYNVSPLDVTAFSGNINYHLSGINISPVSLSELPDFLAGEETNLVLANPQIYLATNNPVASDNLSFTSSLQIEAIRENNSVQTFTADDNINVGTNLGNYGTYSFCLSPSMPDAGAIPGEFENPTHVLFSSLGNILSGNGIPSELRINLMNPQIPAQKVEKFNLGRNLDAVDGRWMFRAPLALEGNSGAKIIYTRTVDGWNDEDVDAITIKKLELSMNVTNDTPLEATMTGHPIDVNGNQISGVTIQGAVVPGNAQNAPVKIEITGEVKHLDGIIFTATITPTSGATLSPNQSITLDNIRAKVTGNYIKEL